MLDFKRDMSTDATIDVNIDNGTFELWNVEWDAGGRSIDCGERGFEYECEWREFVSGMLGGLKIDRDMLVKILSEAQVQSLESVE